jgi:hypothetical protein
LYLCEDALNTQRDISYIVIIFQVFSLSLKDELRREDGCMSTGGNNGDKISLTKCIEGDKNQQFKHDKVSII